MFLIQSLFLIGFSNPLPFDRIHAHTSNFYTREKGVILKESAIQTGFSGSSHTLIPFTVQLKQFKQANRENQRFQEKSGDFFDQHFPSPIFWH